MIEPAAVVAVGMTMSEIRQQPTLWRQLATSTLVQRRTDRDRLTPLLLRPDVRVLVTGAGTSAYAGEILRPALSRRLRRRVEAVASTEIVAAPLDVFAEDVPTVLISLARSGDSPESIAATDLADQLLSECVHIIITCNPDGRLAQVHAARADSIVQVMPVGSNDRGFAMTSSFTCMLLAVLLLLDDPTSPVGLVERLAVCGESILADRHGDARTLAAAGRQRIVYLGSGALHGLARESALKMLELTAGAVTATGESPLGFRHGPKAVLDDSSLVVVFVSTDPYTSAYDLDLVDELRNSVDRDALVVITANPTAVPADVTTWGVADLAAVGDSYLALPVVLLSQLLALEFSLAQGNDPDNPFPGGEVNRVVRGVRLHPLDITRR